MKCKGCINIMELVKKFDDKLYNIMIVYKYHDNASFMA